MRMTMVSTRERVTLQGLLHDRGLEATCRVFATKVTIAGGSDFGYGNYQIDSASVSPSLPDGSYQLSVNGELIPIRFLNGDWLS
jgi:hypothetical protein